MLKRSIVEVAYELLMKKQKPQVFAKMWDDIGKILDMSEEEKENYISVFYTQLSIDERFVLLEDNQWDLRQRHKFDKVHIDMNDIYSEIEEEEKEIEEEAKEDNYDLEYIDDEDDEEKEKEKDDQEDDEEDEKEDKEEY